MSQGWDYVATMVFLLKEDKWIVTELRKYKQALGDKFSVYESL